MSEKIFLYEFISDISKPDEVKTVLYIVEEWGMPCFSLAVAEGQMYIKTVEVRPY